MATIDEWFANRLKAPETSVIWSDPFYPVSGSLVGYIGPNPVYAHIIPGDGLFDRGRVEYFSNNQFLPEGFSPEDLSKTPTPGPSEIQEMYNAVANGQIQISPQDFNKLLINADLAINPGEFASMSQDVQNWARQNPQSFIQQMLANRNPANDDLGSIGAEGGYSKPQNITVSPSGQLDYSNAGYMEVHDEGSFLNQIDDWVRETIPGGWLGVAGAGALGYGALSGGLGGLFGAGTTAADLSGVAGMGVADFATSSALTDAILANYAAGGAGLTGFEGALAGLGGLAEGAGTGLWGSNMNLGDIGNTLGEMVNSGQLTSEEAMQAMQAYNNAASGGTWSDFLAGGALDDWASSTGLSLNDITSAARQANTVKNLYQQLTGSGQSLADILGGSTGVGNLLAGGVSSYLGGQYADKQAALADRMLKEADPYLAYRQQVEIPFRKQMLEKAPGLMNTAEQTGQTAYNTLADMFYQDKLKQSYTDPLAVYNSPEMQALSGQFMNQIARRDAAAGRTSQYGARALEGQNQFLTQALPAYRQGLVQGQGAVTQQGGALGNLFGTQGQYALNVGQQGLAPTGSAGAGAKAFGELMTSANKLGTYQYNPLMTAAGLNVGQAGTNQTSGVSGGNNLVNAGLNYLFGNSGGGSLYNLFNQGTPSAADQIQLGQNMYNQAQNLTNNWNWDDSMDWFSGNF